LIDALARGPSPRSRVRPPAKGARCPRCHRAAGYQACLLCAPELVPARYGGRLIVEWIDAAIVAALLPARTTAPGRLVRA